MRILVPDNFDARQLDRIRAAVEGVELSILRITRHKKLPLRVLNGAARRAVPYALYQRIRPAIDRTEVSISIDGVDLDTPSAGRGIDALVATWVTREVANRVISRLPDLRWVHSTITGVDHLDTEALAGRKIELTSPRGVHARRVGEFVMAIVHAEAKNIPAHVESAGRRRARGLRSQELRDLSLGIVGYGAIGQAVARLALANGLNVIAYLRPGSPPRAIDRVVETSQLDRVLAVSDVLVVALPLTRQTRHLIGARELRLLSPDSLLINVGRAATLVEADLLHALGTGALRCAYLDLVEDMAAPPTHPMYRLDNLVFTGYSASESAHSSEELLLDFIANLRRFTQRDTLHGRVQLVLGY